MGRVDGGGWHGLGMIRYFGYNIKGEGGRDGRHVLGISDSYQSSCYKCHCFILDKFSLKAIKFTSYQPQSKK